MRFRVLIVSALVFAIAPATANTQGVMERLKKAAKEAIRKAEEKQPPQPPPRQPPPRSQPTAPPNTAAVNPGATLPASSAKVEVTLLAPAEAKTVFYVGAHGGHLAAVTQKGSRFVIVHDGVSGPPFDDIIGGGAKQTRLAFSPDGTRYSYVGRLGQEYVVMIDGKEVMRVPVSDHEWGHRLGANLLPDFTSNSKHSYFGFTVKRGAPLSDSRFQLVFDGQLVPAKWSNPKALAFSPDGDHYAYLSESTSYEVPRGTPFQSELIVDGKPAAYPGTDPQFTSDGRHLFTGITSPGGNVVEVFLDGKPYIQAREIKLYFPPVGSGVVAVVSPKIGDALAAFLVIDGKKVAGSDARAISDVFFSPDGKHYAAACETPARSRFMLIDGKKGLEYQMFLPLTGGGAGSFFMFSPDSSRSAYNGHSGGKGFVVVDGTESDGYPAITAFTFGGKDSRRFGFVGVGNSTKEWAIIVDGKATARPNANRDLTFSADGSRYAFSFDDPGPTHRMVVDGVVEEGSVIQAMANSTRDGVGFLFTPDSKHIIHYGWATAERKLGFFIDGRFVQDRVGVRPGSPTFTPDGRHLLWFETVLDGAGRPGGFVVLVDGKVAYRVDVPSEENFNLWTKTAGGWEMGADGVLTLIAREAEALKRIRIAPPADASIDSLFATAVPMRGKPGSPD
jgi:hypothetical protein